MMENRTGARGMRHASSSWEVFDSLPRSVRDAINYGIIKYSTQSLPALVRKHGADSVVKALVKRDAMHVAQVWEEREATEFLKEIGL